MSGFGDPWQKQEPTPAGPNGGGTGSGGGNGNAGGGGGESPTERLLRAALEARANQVGVHDLRPAAPPRGNVRRTRHFYTVVLPLVGLAAAGAVGYFGFHGTADLADRRVAPAMPVTATATATVTVTAAPTGGGANADSGQYLPATWLAPSQYPLFSVFHWKADGGDTPHNTTDPFQTLYSCGTGEPTGELHTVSVSTLNLTPSTQVAQPAQQAAEVMLFFKDAATASTAMSAIEHDYTGCAKRGSLLRTPGTVSGEPLTWTVTRTATSASGFAHRTLLRTPDGKPDTGLDSVSDTQELFVRSGNVIALVSLQGDGADLDPAGDAPQVLAAMAARLAAFPQ